jgi:hypothetical protein
MSDELTENFRQLTPEQQHQARLDAFRREAVRMEAIDPSLVGNIVANRSNIVPTREAVRSVMEEFALLNGEMFRTVPATRLQAAATLNECRRLARDGNTREEYVEEIAAMLAGAENRLRALSELRNCRPDMFGQDNRPLSAEQLSGLKPADYRERRRQHGLGPQF